MRDKLCSFECDFIVLGGDFNLVCDVSKDKKGDVATTNLKAKEEVDAIREDFEPADIWRVLNPEKLQLEEIIAYKTQGAILRSKVKWYNEGEKNPKYFHNREAAL